MKIRDMKILSLIIFLITSVLLQTKLFALEEYVPEVIIKGKWCENYLGCKEPGRFGFAMFEGDPDYPRSFVVDKKENIYILDQYNSRIQVFDSDGKYIKSISIPVECYIPRGIPVKSVELDEMVYYLKDLREIHTDEKGNLYIQKLGYEGIKINQQGKLIERMPFKKWEQVKEKMNPQKFVKEGKQYRVKLDANEKEIIVMDENMNVKKKIKVEIPEKRRWIKLVKVDNKGDIYIGVYDPFPTHILKYDFDGTLITTIRIPTVKSKTFGDITTAESVFVDKKGNVYVMELWEEMLYPHIPGAVPTRVGIRIIKWEKKIK